MTVNADDAGSWSATARARCRFDGRERTLPGGRGPYEGSRSSPGPLGVLKHDAIAVRVLKGPAGAIPVRIERGDGLVARRDHPVNGLLPLRSVGEVEDEQVVLGGRPAREVATLSRELEMVRGPGHAQHDPVEPLVIFKPSESDQAHSDRIKPHGLLEV